MPPRETLVAASSWSNSKALATRVVRAHAHTMFHHCTCGLRGGAAAVAAVMIDYDDRGGCCWDDNEETIMNDYFLYIDM
jgi:hypothetical protein